MTEEIARKASAFLSLYESGEFVKRFAQERSLKTDAAGEGEAVGVPYGNREETCPVTAVERWVSFSGRIGEEPLFCRIDRHGNLKEDGLSGDAINDLVKKRVERTGLGPSRYSGHSLRAVLPTSASEVRV